MTAEEASTERLLAEVAQLNADPSVAGILLQLPIPDKVDRYRLFDAIDPAKDVDAVGAVNVSAFYRAQLGRFIPCTPRGVLTLLNYYGVPIDGAHTAVIGRSDIAGKPLALILGGRMCNATVTCAIATPAISPSSVAMPISWYPARAPTPAGRS